MTYRRRGRMGENICLDIYYCFYKKMPPTTYINKPTYNDTLQAFTGGDI